MEKRELYRGGVGAREKVDNHGEGRGGEERSDRDMGDRKGQ